MAGRKPKPTRMKVLEGNPGRRPLSVNEPQPRRKKPQCPKHLVGEARREWARVSKELFALGLLTVVDRAALAAYCQHWARWVRAEEALQASGAEMVYMTPNGMLRVNPWVAVAKDAMKEMRAFLSEFGMTPSSRTRIQVEPMERVENPLEELVSRSKANAGGVTR